ncbi:MAG: O-methyltransferase [Devosia sp.]|nr:O-methyltransferase [Devosia sp.]
MIEAKWRTVDDYIVDRLVGDAPLLAGVLEANAGAGLPAIDVSAAQGKFLHLMVRIAGARRILELGTLGGYSTIWMAQALPIDGRLETFEYEPRHADVARRNIERAGLSDRVRIHVGAAAETLPRLAAEAPAPFDLFFIDADKPNNPLYLEWAIRLGRPGSVIILDNVVREGDIVNPRSADPRIVGTRLAFDMIGGSPHLDGTALQTVGSKGYDGFALMVVR